MNQARALIKVISTQETLITLASGQVEFRSKQKYNKDIRGKKEEEIHPFEEKIKDIDLIKYDYNKLLYWNKFLKSCRNAIFEAEKTKRIDDDFLVEQSINGEIVYSLTENFWDMLSDLEVCFKSIHQILMVNKVIASGVEEDEELSYKEQEELFKERVREA